MDMLEYSDGAFQVTSKVEQKVREQCSVYATVEIAAEFKKLDTLLEGLNEFCSKYVTDRININIMADTLYSKYIQLPDKSRKIIPNARVFIDVLERIDAVAANS